MATPNESIRDRLMRLEAECAALRELIAIIESGRGTEIDPAISVTTRILTFMQRYPTIAFSSSWLMQAVRANEEVTRKSLTRLKRRGAVEHLRHGRWKLAS